MFSKLIYVLKIICSRKFSFYKKFNFICSLIEWFLIRSKKMLSKPYLYLIEATTACNLRCVKCIHSKEGAIEIGSLTYENFDKIFKKIKKYAIVITFVNWGEPFLNKDIFKMISKCSSEGIRLDFSTSLNLKDKKLLEMIVDSGLEALTISLDGITQNSYSKYRVGGDIRLVFDNIKYLLDYKKKVNSKKPRIFWQFLVNRYNEEEMEQAKKIAKELGIGIFFNKFRPTTHKEVFMPDKEKLEDLKDWLPHKNDISYEKALIGGKKRRCLRPWTMFVINFDGGVYPCCSLVGEEYYFGNILKDSLEDIWKNEKFTLARKIILEKNKLREGSDIVCSICKKNNFTLY